jgi:hypothetical protein
MTSHFNLIEVTHIIFTDFNKKYRRTFIRSIIATSEAIEEIRKEYIRRYGIFDENSKTQQKQIHFIYKSKNHGKN